MFYIHGEIILCITRDHFSSPFRLMVEKSSLKKKKHCFLNECFKNATTSSKDPPLSSTHGSNFVTCVSGKNWVKQQGLEIEYMLENDLRKAYSLRKYLNLKSITHNFLNVLQYGFGLIRYSILSVAVEPFCTLSR